MRKVYALLVGINDYPTVPKLHGCLNDVDNMHRWLKKSVSDGLAAEVLKDHEATRENVIGQFRKHLGKARSGDAVFFHYCGHGAQAYAAPEFKTFEPDGLDEGLVLYDSRQRNGWDLADKEVALLIGKVAQSGAEVVFALDSCHSGSGTRDTDEFNGLVARLAERRTDTRPLDSYLDGAYVELLKPGGKGRLQKPGRHILLAACDRSQTAKETEDKSGGVFTTALVEVLARHRGQLSYRDLFLRCQSDVRSRARKQDPRFECIGGFDGWGGFLGGQVGRPSLRHLVSFNTTQSVWTLDAGAADGLGDGTHRPAKLTLYKEGDLDHPLHQVRTTAIGLQASDVTFEGPPPPVTDKFVAAVTSMPAHPLPVHCEDDALRETWQAELDGPGAVLAACGALLCKKAEGTRYALAVDGKVVKLLHPGPPQLRPAVPFDPADPAAAARAMRHPLSTVVRWERLLGLNNRHSEISPGDIEIACEELAGASIKHRHIGTTLTFQSSFEDGEWSEVPMRFSVRKSNSRSDQPLYAALLYFSPEFGIEVHAYDGPLLAGEWCPLTPASALSLNLDPETRQPLETEVRLKLVVSTSLINADLLMQQGLDQGPDGAERGWKVARPTQDWLRLDMVLRMVPRGGQIGAESDCPLAEGQVVIRKHSRLKAQVSLSQVGSGTRSADEGAPFLESFQRAGLELVGFSGGERSADASVLEITGIENAGQLDGEPLQIELRAPLPVDTSLLAFHHDGVHLLPIGQVQPQPDGSQLLSIGHIPEAGSGSRSVAGALKLFFFKTQLKMADVNGLKRMSYDTVPCRHVDDLFDLEVRDQRILLLVHGIIGDTQGMAESLRGIGLHRQFDLVLSYDYENLNTPIEDTARRLKQQLDRVGLRAGQGQKITVLAHSMGGLVARWFIEREGGHGLVEHLVMCGTPNRGSPFSRLDEVAHWLDFLKGLAANLMPEHLSPITRIVSHLLKSVAFTDLTKTLDQMRPASAFIHSLNSEADPGVRYTILAGNVRDYQAPANAHFTGLLDKLAKSHSFGLLFDEKPHDIAVALDSITRVSARRLPEQTLDILPVACHHLNYFSSEAGQQALMKAMSRP